MRASSVPWQRLDRQFAISSTVVAPNRSLPSFASRHPLDNKPKHTHSDGVIVVERLTGPRNAVRLLIAMLLAGALALQAENREQDLSTIHRLVHQVYEAIPNDGDRIASELVVNTANLHQHLVEHLFRDSTQVFTIVPPVGPVLRQQGLTLQQAVSAYQWIQAAQLVDRREPGLSLTIGGGLVAVLADVHEELSRGGAIEKVTIEFRNFEVLLPGGGLGAVLPEPGSTVPATSDLVVSFSSAGEGLLARKDYLGADLQVSTPSVSTSPVAARVVEALGGSSQQVVSLHELNFSELEEHLEAESLGNRSVALFGQAIQRRTVGLACAIVPLCVLAYLCRFSRGVARGWGRSEVLGTQSLGLLGSQADRVVYHSVVGITALAACLTGLLVLRKGVTTLWCAGGVAISVVTLTVLWILSVQPIWKLVDSGSDDNHGVKSNEGVAEEDTFKTEMQVHPDA